MRTAQQPVNRAQQVFVKSIPAPVGGWNARDSLTEMDPKDAVGLDNFFCTPSYVTLRKGNSQWASGITGNVNTIATYAPSVGSNSMFAFAGANVYDVSNKGAVSGATLTGNASDKFQTLNMGAAGNFLIAASGSDLPLVYDGTAWGNIFAAAFVTTVTSITSSGTLATVTMPNPHNLKTGMSVVVAGFTPTGYNGTYVVTVTGANTFTYTLGSSLGVTTVTGTVTPSVNFAITGVNPILFNYLMMFKSRLWAIEKNSLRIWYMPALSIGGAANVVDLSALCHNGGYVIAMADWTLDAGTGLDDYAAFFTSMGQVVVYQGTDPASSSTWSLVGVFDVGNPVGTRCVAQYGGDVLLINQDGLGAISKDLMSSRVSTQAMLTDKIQSVISEYTTNYATNFGWEIDLFPPQNMLILNVPISTTQSYQLVMNTISGAWSRFIGWNAFCFELNANSLYFGVNGGVCLAWDTYADLGQNINFDAQQAFSYLDAPGQQKQVQMVRPVIATDGNPTILFGVNADYDTSDPMGIPLFQPVPTGTGVWDTNDWDDGSVWGGALTIKKDWQTAFANGYALSPHMTGGFSNFQLQWMATDIMYTPGGVL
jgi:hypothetical protein